MIKRSIKIAMTGILLVIAIFFCVYWINTQPIWVWSEKKIDEPTLSALPEKNKQIIQFVENDGNKLAPTYDGTVCTEFVIKVIKQFSQLSSSEENIVRIITTKNLDSLIQTEDPVIKGVQTALITNLKGVEISSDEVQPGDFVQFWNTYRDTPYGHCGIVFDVKPTKTITVCSSHPLTRGYGKQEFLWPDKIYFVRLK